MPLKESNKRWDVSEQHESPEQSLITSASSSASNSPPKPSPTEDVEEKGKVEKQLLVRNDDSSESSANSSDSGSPPRAKSLPTDSPPQSSSPETGLRVLARSAPTKYDIRIEPQQNDASEQQTKKKSSQPKSRFGGWFSFFSSKHSKRIESLTLPLISMASDQESASLKPA